MRPFSPNYPTFNKWLKAMPRTSRYAQEVIKLKKLNPTATLKQIRTRKNLISNLSKIPFEFLTSTQKNDYRKSLEVLRLLRNENIPLTKAVKKIEISIKKVLQYTGNTIKKIRGKYYAKDNDNLYRKLRIFEKGKLRSITVTNYKDAQLIGKYHSSIKKAIKQNSSEPLKEFEDAVIVDSEGIKHTLETDLDQIYLIDERMESPEYFEIYADE
jgi:hypothetical protein